MAAKLLSLHAESFCYAGETHLLPILHSMFAQLPCNPDRLDEVVGYLHRHFMTVMVEMPRYSVSKGAHPKNLIFNEQRVSDLSESLRHLLRDQLHGAELHKAALELLSQVLAQVEPRPVRGEKTPSNLFAMAEYAARQGGTRNIAVIREPLGIIRSMKGRAAADDPYAGPFKGGVEANIGMYLEYAESAQQLLAQDPGALTVRYEALAMDPASAVRELFGFLGFQAEERILQFVEKGGDRELADRAPFNYKRLQLSFDRSGLADAELWKIYSLTRHIRRALGYSDDILRDYGFDIPTTWPALAVPETIIPLYGFAEREPGTSATYMKRRGALVAYLGTGGRFDIRLWFRSNLPEYLTGPHQLELRVNGALQASRPLAAGPNSFEITLTLKKEDLIPMGSQGGYAILSLRSSVACCPLAHDHSGQDAREISVELSGWSINRVSTWPWLRLSARQ